VKHIDSCTLQGADKRFSSWWVLMISIVKLYLHLMSLRLTQFAAFWCPENHPKLHVEGRVWRVLG